MAMSASNETQGGALVKPASPFRKDPVQANADRLVRKWMKTEAEPADSDPIEQPTPEEVLEGMKKPQPDPNSKRRS